MTHRAFHADAVLPGDAAPIADGAVVVDASGIVVEVGPAASVLPRHAGVRVERIRGVVFPGLVNAHTHLELSGLRGKVAGGAGFVPWLQRLLTTRGEERPEDDGEAIDAAVAELVAAGTAAVGDVSNSLATVGALARAGLAGSVFHEVFGLAREAAMARVETLERGLDEVAAGWPSRDLVYAPSPHTLFTTHPDAVRAVLALARRLGVRASLHLAEHPAERAFLATRTGPMATLAASMAEALAAFPVPATDPVRAARALGALGPDVLAVHLADARPDELALVAESGAPVVACPRSNLFIEVRLPPMPAMLAAGIVPALGTDSLASNASLDVLAEARALTDRFPAIAARTLLEMATTAGARALGRADLGRIAPGARPGLVACALDAEGADPCAAVVRSRPSSRRWVVRRSPLSSEGT